MTDSRTLVLIKPDAVRRGLAGTILARYEAKGLTVLALELRQVDATLADRHYADHVAKGWYPELREYITSGPLIAIVLEAPGVIDAVRLINGATDGSKAAPGTIRGDFAMSKTENLVHASDSPESAEREISIWFPELAA